jgi:molybdenum cofactor cytidylyltransferase
VTPLTKRPFVSGLLLAAGTSSRFGRVKQLAELGGVTLVERAARMLEESDVDEVVVVLGHASQEVKSRLAGEHVRIVFNPNFRAGLGSSVAAGVRSLDRRSEAVVVCLSDQPFVTTGLVNRVVSRFVETRADAVAAAAGDIVSPPMLLSKSLYGQLRELKGDKGAKGIVMRQAKLESVEVARELLFDIDTEDELKRARQRSGAASSEGTARARGGPSRRRPSAGS